MEVIIIAVVAVGLVLITIAKGVRIVPQGEKRLALFEAKSTKTPVSNHAKPLRQLLRVLNDYQTHTDVVHQPAKGEL